MEDSAKTGRWLLRRAEDRLRPKLARLVPRFVETYHLTLMSLVWSAGVIVSGYLAQIDLRWLWLSSAMVACHYITDLLDGTIGRMRNTGLVKWGYYMDHFLDYVFFTALLMSYAYILPSAELPMLMLLSFMQIGFMVSMFLSFSATDKLGISFAGVGPTEVRLLYILFNTYLVYFGTALPVAALPYFTVAVGVVLAIFVLRTQRKIWHLDMDIKKQRPL